MSADDMTEFYVHAVTVETLTGPGSYGDVFAAPVTVHGLFEGKKRLLRNADGEQVVSGSVFYTTPDSAPLFFPDSRVTFNGLPSRVISAGLHTSGDLDLPDHLEVDLT